MNHADGRVVVLCGGIGGAKLVLGLSRTLNDGRLTVIGNNTVESLTASFYKLNEIKI